MTIKILITFDHNTHSFSYLAFAVLNSVHIKSENFDFMPTEPIQLRAYEHD